MTVTATPTPARDTRGWPAWLVPLTAAWLGGWGALALLGTVTGAGYPFRADRTYPELGLLRLLPDRLGPPVFAAVLLTAAVAVLAMAGTGRPSRPLRAALLGYGWAVAFALAVVVPDTRVLPILGYLPMLVLGAPFGWPPVDYSTVFDWALLAKVAALAGGVLLAVTLLAWGRRTAGACVACGRDGTDRAWTTPAAAARWGRWAAWFAAAIPLCYAATRFAWVLGIPLGISSDFLDELHETGLVWAGAGLGAFATVGAVLTVGLTRPWGERFPRWMPRLAGRRVPPRLALVPAILVALTVTGAGVAELGNPGHLLGGFSSATAPLLLWPLWGPALGAAALAYHLRRRGACRRCGRD
ncbi:hypothetical protein ABGB16_15300 [Micromonospora sp. B11E3]|uniref:hypothetical protein n=1 Tax=Micromonospora sp. B11E3 TaxID=3153562 RepID=UPI00325F4854